MMRMFLLGPNSSSDWLVLPGQESGLDMCGKSEEMVRRLLLGGIAAALIGALVLLVLSASQSASVSASQEGRWEKSTPLAPAGARVQASSYHTGPGENPNAVTGGKSATENAGPGDGQLQVLVSDWITWKGTITAVELNAVTIETTQGESFLIQLGPEYYWTEQGTTLQEGDQVLITGFYEEQGTWSAGEVALLGTGETLALRDAHGSPLWAEDSSNASGQGQGRGGKHRQ